MSVLQNMDHLLVLYVSLKKEALLFIFPDSALYKNC